MYLNDEKKELMNNYINQLSNSGKKSEIVETISEYINASYSEVNKKYTVLKNILWDNDTKHISDVFEGEKYEVLQILLGDQKAETFKNIWNRSTEYIYSTGEYRRSYRTNKSSQLYIEKNIGKLIEAIYLAAIDFSAEKYFESNKSDYRYIEIIADIIAIEIDNKNKYVLEKIKEVVYNDNNTSIITREIIKGLLMSKNEEAHKIIGELLLAAKLQEGLRQSIVETLDEGSKEAVIYIFKLILDNNLMRFSSVTRAFGTWTGLPLDVERLKVTSKCFEVAYNCLINEEYRNECLDSSDNLLIYISIWSVSFYEVEDIDSVLDKLLSANEKYKKLVALQFLYDTQFNVFKHSVACKVLGESDLEVIALAIKNLYSSIDIYELKQNPNYVEDYYYGIDIFNDLKRIVEMMPKKEVEFKGSVFPWVDFKLSTTEIILNMLTSVVLSYNDDVVDTLIDYKDKMSVDSREVLIEVFLKEPKTNKHKLTLIEACGDRAQSVREVAFKQVNDLKLTKEDYALIENLLQYKSGDLRKSAIKLLLKQESSELVGSVKRLLSSKNENKNLGAIDIVSAIEVSVEHKEIFKVCLDSINSMDNISQKGALLTKNIGKKAEDINNFENGFGLYDKLKEYEVSIIEKPKDFNIKSKFSRTENEFLDILNKFSGLINEYRDVEYEIVNWDDSKTMVTLGGSNYLQSINRENSGLDNYPIADKIREFAKSNKLEGWKLIELDFYLKMIFGAIYEVYLPWYKELLEENYNCKIIKGSLKTVEHIGKIKTYINLLVGEIPENESFEIGKAASKYMYTVISKEKHYEEYLEKKENFYNFKTNFIASSNIINYWLCLMGNNCDSNEAFSQYFEIAYSYYRACKYTFNSTLELEDFGQALDIGIIDKNEIFKELMERPLSKEHIKRITNLNRNDRKNLSGYTKLIEIANRTVEIITESEVKRGELNTEVTHLAAEICECYGVNIFTSIILASEKDTYIRGYNFLYGDCTKKQMFSHLLKCCYPKEGEDSKTLKEQLKGKKITSKQLVEAAMYAPQWLDIISEYLGYEGLKSACWYFHAHVNDNFTNEKSAIVARYTPISTDDLKDGAFDQNWFIESYKTLGEKNFKIVYDSAKYIAGGGLHKRSQLFADATLGDLNVQEVKNRIMDKRNKDYLLTYGLIPVINKEDILERYEYIHKYKKESKQFGAQRQASEGRSANIALLNLARNAGYSDVNRLTWDMETARIDSVKTYLEPQKVEDVEIQLVIDELGQTDIICTKGGKELKNIPAKLKKHEYIVEVKELKKSLKDQYVRARQCFEVSMETGEIFKGEELINLCKNPVISPIIKNLVFKAGDKFGYINGDSLVDCKNEVHELNNDAEVIIAHPVHLFEAEIWSDYQKDIFNKSLLQPFKQVFRELYLPNADELKELTLSRRYAGHQVQPKKTAALLKTRGWIVSNEEGLQKVYYNEDIIATIYAIADWFSPTEIESPTIEYVRFEERKTYKPVPIDKIPKLIFSEVMRDLDLVVSVAHVGGVDPEASLSTVEIRIVIVEEILRLKKLSNIELKGSHAYITGVHGEYTVHLGSGVVHKMGTGSINILPVHSSHRGRIFLPFIDGDPKSSEIISKIIFLAEDVKIKDPSVLEQIVG